MNLVMTHRGLQVEAAIPDEEIPQEITFQGVRYVQERTCTFERVPSCIGGLRSRYRCSACGWSDYSHEPRNFCPECGARIAANAVEGILDDFASAYDRIGGEDDEDRKYLEIVKRYAEEIRELTEVER